MKKIAPVIFIFFLLIFPTVFSASIVTDISKNIIVDDINKNTVPSDNWGFYLVAECTVNYIEVIQNISGDIVWWGMPSLSYKVIGIGRHDIHWELEYEVYTYDEHVPQPQAGTFQGNDSIYLFNIHERPIIKLRAKKECAWPFFLFHHGEWWGRLYINGELIVENYMEYTHH